MTRIGILVQPDFLEHHVGVRNYMLTLYQYLVPKADVRFLSYYRPPHNPTTNWYWLHVQNPGILKDNGVTEDWRLTGTPLSVLEQYHAGGGHPGHVPTHIWYAQFGPRLETGNIDVLIISNPWLVDFTDRLPVPRQIGIVYDAIPNRYCLTEGGKPFTFASQHLNGFRYFRSHCDDTLAISEASSVDLVDLMRFTPDQVGWLPPIVPVDCLKTTSVKTKRSNTILLASPLDRRKGLVAMPRLVAAAGPKLEGLKMYGAVRCSPDELTTFFRELPRNLPVEWYPRATSKTTERLFREAKLTLFPSLNEGLGLPLIEAQLRGCPVVTRNARPMSDLTLGGSCLLTDEPAKDAAIVRELFETERFDHAGLETQAREFFHTATLPDRVFRQLQGRPLPCAVVRAA